jgi:iodotyrosine deiodinase
MTNAPQFIDLSDYQELPVNEMLRRAQAFSREMQRRRTVREFSSRPVAREVIEHCLQAAGSAPSGANLQPWRFVVVTDPATKGRIRLVAEAEEREFYAHRAPQEWLEALAVLGTDSNKPFLEVAPYLIVVFRTTHEVRPDGSIEKQYYSSESVGIATGLLLTALHIAGLATLTHTPSPMQFLNQILNRPTHERPFLIVVAGYPAPGAKVPAISRKRLEQIVTWYES